MKNVFSRTQGWVSNLRRTFIVGLVTLSLVGTTLVAPAHAADADDYYTNERGGIQTTERYDQIQPDAGGMNGFDDVDPRRNTREAEGKAKVLIDSSKRRNLESADPLEGVREAVDNIKESVGETADDLTSKASDRLDKVGNKLDRAADRTGNRLDRAADRTGDKARRALND
ncbi:MAG: hypothetical protein WBA76_01985 [Phormidesmis sp.]